jgi:N-acetylneuraminic acid mutarotase
MDTTQGMQQMENYVIRDQQSQDLQLPLVKIISNPNMNNECPQIKNHSTILYNRCLYIFGGYDGKKNHNTLHVYNLETNEWSKPRVFGDEPAGRNGHTATLIENKMYIIGGWLGSGPFAASDMYILDLDSLLWQQPVTAGSSPGPCNMHSADLIGKMLYIFRGGDGRDYLNDLHAFDVENNTWCFLNATGDNPPPRANHSSAVIGKSLFVFGGWDGSKRLNDLYRLDTEILKWTEIKAYGAVSPRAGMSLCNINSKLYLFGGSGPSASCFNDLQVFNPETTTWVMAETINAMDKPIKARAGHSMTVYEGKLFIMGGSYGQSYFKEFYIIDTDPAPDIISFHDNAVAKMRGGLRDYCNNQELCDVTFIVEGKPFYGHKVILSLLSEKFRSMFSLGMKESNQNQIPINHISYPVFAAICQYLYTGEVHFGADTEGQELSLEYMLEFLRVSDEYMLDEIKTECEKHLANLINEKTFHKISEFAMSFHADQLKRYCDWYYGRFAMEIEKGPK